MASKSSTDQSHRRRIFFLVRRRILYLVFDAVTEKSAYLYAYRSWWRGTVVERRSLAGELSLSCARPAADG